MTKNLRDSLKIIEEYITFIYDNEEAFIKDLLDDDSWDISKIAFSGYKCYITYVMYSGQHIDIAFNNAEIIDWIERQKEKLLLN